MEHGKEAVLATIASGDYFGELVLDGGPRSASIMALEPCRFYVIPHGDVERMLAANPEFARDLIHKLIGKVRSLTGRVRDLAMKDVYARLAHFLEEGAVESEGQRVLAERLTQSDIAARIGGSREMVSRILRDLAAGGYIAVDSKQITNKAFHDEILRMGSMPIELIRLSLTRQKLMRDMSIDWKFYRDLPGTP